MSSPGSSIFARPSTLAAAALAALVAAGCGPVSDSDAAPADGSAMDPPPEPAPVRSAQAILRPTGGGQTMGTVHFEAMETGGVRVTARVQGLEPGAHAFHVHRRGDCTAADGSSAGAHFPFVPLEEGAEPDFITGNLGEIPVAEDGTGTFTREIPIAELNGPRAIPGRAVVVHRDENHPEAAPGGDTGARVACGVIGISGTG